VTDVRDGLVGAGVAEVGRGERWPRYVGAGLGLRNYWYPAFFSAELGEGQVRGEEICGERVLFKRVGGVVYGVADRCVHRGVSFSDSPQCHSVNTVSCWLHGFTYDVRDGRLVQVITDPGCGLIGKVGLAVYPVREVAQTVFVWVGGEPVADFEADMPDRFTEMLRLDRRVALIPHMRVKIAGDWRLGAENAVDNSHFYGHQQAPLARHQMPFPLAIMPGRDDIETVAEPGSAPYMRVYLGRSKKIMEADVEGVTVRTAAPRELLDDADPDSSVSHFLPGILQLDGNQRTPWDYYWEWYVPVNEDYHTSVMLYGKVVDSDAEEQAWRDHMFAMFPLVWSTDPEVDGFLNFDGFVREKSHHVYKHENWFQRARLYRPDALITDWRRFVETHARDICRRDGNWARREQYEPPEIVYDIQGRHLPPA
jgi:carbazole 1,9a-dioxygenase